jgi:class 3 adenylate cyclase
VKQATADGIAGQSIGVAGFGVHLFISAAVCGLCVAVWTLTIGSPEQLRHLVQHPDEVKASFWPVWVILPAAAALLAHLGAVLSIGLFGRRGRRRRRRMAGEAARAMKQGLRQAHAIRHGAPGSAGAGAESAAAAGASKSDDAPKPSGPQRQWVTVMFTDIVDSTGLTERLGDDEWSRVLGRYRELTRHAFATRGGAEVGTQGDGFLARFPSPADAVLCGVDIQRELDELRESVGEALEVRIGIHAGEAVHDDGDLVGRVVNVAARVTSAAVPGEILVTEPVADYLGGRLELDDRGLHPLRGVSQPRHLLAVVWQEPTGDGPTTTAG